MTKTLGTLATGDIVKAARNRRAVITNPCNEHGHAIFRYIVKGRLAKGAQGYIFSMNVAEKADLPVEVYGTYTGAALDELS